VPSDKKIEESVGNNDPGQIDNQENMKINDELIIRDRIAIN